jgi:hypothetical protein
MLEGTSHDEGETAMRIERTITTVSWIPSDSLQGMLGLGEKLRVAHHDQPPPDTIGSPADEVLDALRAGDRYRFSNQLRAWIELQGGTVTGYGYSGAGRIGATTVHLGVGDVTVPAVPYEPLRAEPEVGDGWVRFRQTSGGRTGVPIPRAVKHPPFVQYRAPTVWTTLELTIRADGTHDAALTGASHFPRHWVYDDAGRLVAKSGLTELKRWLTGSFGKRTPWGDEDTPAVVTAVESALERDLAERIMRGALAPEVRRLRGGDVVTVQGAPATEVALLLDGIAVVEVDGTAVVELGPGAVLGERALVEGGRRTSTVRCVTPCRVAVVPGRALERSALAELAARHRRAAAPA